jgi:hypothetical protein
MKLKLLIMCYSLLLVFGIALTVMSYSNQFSWNEESFDTETISITANSSNMLGFHYAPVGESGAVKEVTIRINNVVGKSHINHPFEISVLNGQNESIKVIESAPPGGGIHTFYIPSLWNSLGGVLISNPEVYLVTVNVEVILHSQTINNSWHRAFVIGAVVTAIGLVLTVTSVRKSPSSYTSSP